MSRPKKGGDISAIFVHAGAGFHSHQNERAHLEACDNAAKVAMAVLRAGGSAVDAVEMAIVALENHEITNAGYGSNLTMNGFVECDATIVDHLGRSGAVGAVEQVKNPISLARVILRDSTIELSLNRVPPNFLVGKGATNYAYESGLVTLHDDGLISPAARERWQRWSNDLERANRSQKQHDTTPNDTHTAFLRQPMKVHPAQLLATPSSMGSKSSGSSPLLSNVTDNHEPISDDSYRSPEIQGLDTTPNAGPSSERAASSRVKDPECMDGAAPQPRSSNTCEEVDGRSSFMSRMIPTEASKVHIPTSALGAEHSSINSHLRDNITDTVGAIAVDCKGNIAAGSSSGGIGMKHRGRVGPAALVGIGTAVIPADPNDPDGSCVAVVTSGTGEHIATTMAASTCASRIYHSQRKGKGGVYEDVTEEEAMNAMIAADFMDHPGVKSSHCQGAIGIMAVKKTNDGVFLYFGHNTDSFALASMSSQDSKPVCVMSRNNGIGSIAQGGRACRYKRYRIRRIPDHADSKQ